VNPVRGTKREAIRVDPELWRDYGLACAALGTDRSKDIRALMERRVKAWKTAQKKAAGQDE